MKSVKLILVAVLFATAIVNTANADIPRRDAASNIIRLTYMEAIQVPGLVAAMQAQLNGAFLGSPGINTVTLRVKFQNHVYLITGTRAQWNAFFNYNGIIEKPRIKIVKFRVDD